MAPNDATPVPLVPLSRPTKADLVDDIARSLSIAVPGVSNGSSVDSTFLDRVHLAKTGDSSRATDAYRKTEQVMIDVGLTYDAAWDTSELAEAGGSTVTARAYSRIRSAVLKQPRCFVIVLSNEVMSGVAASERFDFFGRAGGRWALTDAGPGSRVLFVTGRSRSHVRPRMHGWVKEVQGTWDGNKSLVIEGLAHLLDDQIGVDMRSVNDVVEVAPEQFEALLPESSKPRKAGVAFATAGERFDPDRGGATIAARLVDNHSPLRGPSIEVPETLVRDSVSLGEVTLPNYEMDELGVLSARGLPTMRPDRSSSKLAEARAIQIAANALTDAGWILVRDRQADGAGYDLLFRLGRRELHVEVKGIMGSLLAFNLTPKETWRVESDADFVIVAVTSVLSPTSFQVHLITRDQLAGVPRIALGYRVRL